MAPGPDDAVRGQSCPRTVRSARKDPDLPIEVEKIREICPARDLNTQGCAYAAAGYERGSGLCARSLCTSAEWSWRGILGGAF